MSLTCDKIIKWVVIITTSVSFHFSFETTATIHIFMKTYAFLCALRVNTLWVSSVNNKKKKTKKTVEEVNEN